jgi:amino acid transporter
MILVICIIFIIVLAIIFFVHKHNFFVNKHNNNTVITPQRGLSFNKKDKDYNIIGGIGGIGFV